MIELVINLQLNTFGTILINKLIEHSNWRRKEAEDTPQQQLPTPTTPMR